MDGVGYGCSGERRTTRERKRERERGKPHVAGSYTCNVARRMRYRTLTRATYRLTTIPYEEYIIYSLLPRYCTDCPGWQARYFDKYGTCRGYYLETTTRHNPGTVFLPPFRFSYSWPPRRVQRATERGRRPEKKSRGGGGGFSRETTGRWFSIANNNAGVELCYECFAACSDVIARRGYKWHAVDSEGSGSQLEKD